MATAKVKVQRQHPTAEAVDRGGAWFIIVPNVAPNVNAILGSSAHRESWAWADAWRALQPDRKSISSARFAPVQET